MGTTLRKEKISTIFTWLSIFSLSLPLSQQVQDWDVPNASMTANFLLEICSFGKRPAFAKAASAKFLKKKIDFSVKLSYRTAKLL